MKKYVETENGSLQIGDMTIPANLGNRDYRIFISELGKKIVAITDEQGLITRHEVQDDPDGVVIAELESFDHDASALQRCAQDERYWRDSELARSDIELFKIQDGASGTEGEWRDYRVALRDLPEHEQFPLLTARPAAPDA